MGCDYFIQIQLEIIHPKGKTYYNVKTKRCYFCEIDLDHINSDDEDDCIQRQNEIEHIRQLFCIKTI